MDHDNGTITNAYIPSTESFSDQSHDHFQLKKIFLNKLIEDNNGNILLHIQLEQDHFATLITMTVKISM